MAKRKNKDEISDVVRNNTQVPLTPEANKLVAQWCDQSGQPKAVFIQRLLEWFTGMPAEAQQAIAGVVPPAQREVYANIMSGSVKEWRDGGVWPRPKADPHHKPRVVEINSRTG